MNEAPIQFPIAPSEFGRQIRTNIDQVVTEKLSQQKNPVTSNHLQEKVLLKPPDICKIFRIAKPTLYEWLKQERFKSFNVKSRRYFLRTEIESLITGKSDAKINSK